MNPSRVCTFGFFDKNPIYPEAQVLLAGMTQADGKFVTSVSLPLHMSSVWVVGFMQKLEVQLASGSINHRFGGSMNTAKGGAFEAPKGSKNYQYVPGLTFNNLGVPNPMLFDPLPAGYVNRIATTFMEGVDLRTTHPGYFANGAMTLLKIDQPVNHVYVTFLHENASYKNVFGYYVYDQGQTINSVADLGPLTIVFPNTSYSGSGGGLQSGNMIDLGPVAGGKMLGYFIIANGWLNGSNVGNGYGRYFANENLNPEYDPFLRKHAVQCFDAEYQRMVVAFEDIERTPGFGSDHDYNDLVFSVVAEPWSSIDVGDVPPLDPGVDDDGDGVIDDLDDYPDDPDRAFDNYTPGENVWGSLAYEDLWPAYGDYDFNDLVIRYNINQVTNAQNKVKEIKSQFKLMAIGAAYRNGFALEMPFDANVIASTTSNLNLHSVVSAGSKAVVKVFNNAFDLIPQVPGQFINTVEGQQYHTPVLITLNMTLNTPQDPSTFNYLPPYNPFIFRSDNPGLEIHLADYPPTALMNMSMLGTSNDTSNPATGRYFKSAENLPWAIHIAAEFEHPVERAQITRAYNKFKHWAQSSGTSYPDWYMPKPGFRNAEFIYQTP